MAGTIIADKIQTENAFLTLNVGQTLVATINSSGILNSSGGTMVGANGSVSNTAITGFITASQLATSLNLATNNVQVASIQTATGTPAITFAANGQMTLANTPLQLTGGQIKFPGTQIASGDANTLDDYEEGTWTPVYTGVSGSAGTAAYGSGGAYVKVGNLVTLRGTISVTNKGSWSGKILITGCPFPPSTSVYPAVSVGIWYDYTTSVLSVSGYLNGTGGQIIPLHQTGASTTNIETLVSDIAVGWTYQFSLSYPI